MNDNPVVSEANLITINYSNMLSDKINKVKKSLFRFGNINSAFYLISPE